MKWLTLVSALLLSVAACSSGGGSGGTGGGSASGSCGDLASQECSKISSCASVIFQLSYPDMATCVSTATARCQNGVSANGATATGSEIEACAEAMKTAACGDVLSNQLPAACTLSGTLTAGTPCGADIQCAEKSFCNIGTNSTCGVCAAQAAAGATCTTNASCQTGLVCAGATCTSPGAQGATCSAMHPCQSALSCNNGTCGAPLGAGAKCMTGACDLLQGLVCSQAGVCAAVGLAAAGQPCGEISGNETLCTGGGTCELKGTMGTCAAPVANGQACGGTNGDCGPGAVCVDSLCAVPNASSCK